MVRSRTASSTSVKRRKSSRMVRPLRLSSRSLLNKKSKQKFLRYYSNHAGKLFGLTLKTKADYEWGGKQWFLGLHQLSQNKSPIVASGYVTTYRDKGQEIVEISDVEKTKSKYADAKWGVRVRSPTHDMALFRPFLEWAILLARARKIHRIRLDCYSPKLADYYAKFGFRVVRSATRASDGAQSFVMELALP